MELTTLGGFAICAVVQRNIDGALFAATVISYTSDEGYTIQYDEGNSESHVQEEVRP